MAHGIGTLRADLPAAPQELIGAPWQTVASFYDALAAVPLSADTAAEWLAAWSQLEDLLEEARHLVLIAYTADTTNPVHEAAYLQFNREITPARAEQQARLAARVVESGCFAADLDEAIRRFHADVAVTRDAASPAVGEIELLKAAYQKRIASIAVPWRDSRVNLTQLAGALESDSRLEREAAFRAESVALRGARDELADAFTRMRELRAAVARSSGFANFRNYSFVARHRFDYTPGDVAGLRDAIRVVVVPALARVLTSRRARLGLDRLRPWDLRGRAGSEPPLRPFRSHRDLVAHAHGVFTSMDPTMGAWFSLLRHRELLDLEARPGKAPGAFCAALTTRREPYISMSAVGTAMDVETLFHECGHAFHDLAARDHPLYWHRTVGTEVAELASTALELLATPYLARPGGFYSAGDALRVRRDQLETILYKLAHIAAVDEFQEWVYTDDQGADADARDRMWCAIRDRYEPVVDWSGLERDRELRWYRQQHIFRFPFYYIEYALAQLAAIRIAASAADDPTAALRRYRDALALGATVPLAKVYEVAGADLVFDEQGIRPLVAFVEAELTALELARLTG